MESQNFSSRLTSVLTMLGVSVGLGNVWRFPYMMGSYGGSAFVVVYLLFTLLFAIPALMAEMTLGSLSRRGTVDALRISYGKRTGESLGYLLLFVVIIAGSYYAVVIGNVFFTAGYSLAAGFSEDTTSQYHTLLSNGWLQYLATMLMVVGSLIVINKGLTKGIEFLSKFIMPFFFLAIIYMIIHSLMLPGAIEKCREFLRPQWSAMGPPEIFAAMGQAFFSVGLGGTFVIAYSSYLKKEEQIPVVAILTGLGDMGSSILVSLLLVPALLVFGLNIASGPALIFQTFPELFSTMPGGRWVGTLFLFSILIVAFLSLVAAYQVPLTSIQHEHPYLKRRNIVMAIGLSQALLALPSSLYPDIIGTLDLIFGSGMQVFGSLLCIVGLSWGLIRRRSAEHIFGRNSSSVPYNMIVQWIKWAVPLALVCVLAGYIYDSVT